MTIDPAALKPILETLLSLARKAGAEQADAIATHGISQSIGVRAGELEDVDNSENKDIGLRVLVGKRQACVSSSDLSKISLEQLADRAVAMAKLAPEDPYCGLADADNLAADVPDLQITDPAQITPEDLFARAKDLDRITCSVKGVTQAEGANAHAMHAATYFVTSGGFAGGWDGTRHGLSVAAIAANNDGMERDYDYASDRWLSNLPTPEKIALEAGARAVARLGSKKLPSGAMPVFFEKRVASSLLGAFISAISGPTITRGNSFLKDMMNEQVFRASVNVIDDPLRKRGHGSRPWDGEGVKVAPLNLVEDGRLQSWIMNSASARQLGLQTTGHASRSVSSPPGVSTSNTYIAAGQDTPEVLMTSMGTGLLVCEMFGPSLNGNTGDYSVGVAGFLLKDGERQYPVSEITIAGNLKDMFMTMTPANDLVFNGSMVSPGLLIPEMVIAGE